MAPCVDESSLQSFVLNGYLIVPPSATLPKEFHQALYDRTEAACEQAGMMPPKEPWVQGSLWEHSDMAKVVSTPEMHKSLEAILGPSYVVYPHRHMHTCSPLGGQEWHQDPSILPVRTCRPRAVLAMYYPGDVELLDGPTGFLPGSHYMTLAANPTIEFSSVTEDLIEGQQQKMIQNFTGNGDGAAFEQEVNESAVAFDNSNASKCLPPQPSFGVLKGGSFVINHYDIIHRGTMRLPGGKFRPMYKFLIIRSAIPAPLPGLPTTLPQAEALSKNAGRGQMALWQCTWEWLTASSAAAAPLAGSDAQSLEVAATSLLAGKDPYMALLGQAFLLTQAARGGDSKALSALLEGLEGGSAEKSSRQRVRKAAMMALSEVGEAAAAPLLERLDKQFPDPGEVDGLLARTAATYVLGELAQFCSQEFQRQLGTALFAQLKSAAKRLWDPKLLQTQMERITTAAAAGKFDMKQLGDWKKQGDWSKQGDGKKQGDWSKQGDWKKQGDWSKQGDWKKPGAGDDQAGGYPSGDKKPVPSSTEGKAGWSKDDWGKDGGGKDGKDGWGKDGKDAGKADMDMQNLDEPSKILILQKRTGGVPPASAAKQLALMTSFAIGNLGQALAGSPLVAEFLTLVKDGLACPGLDFPRDNGSHAPYPPDLLALAAVSACTQPGKSQEAHLKTDTPPRMTTDRTTVTFLALALARWKAEDDEVSATLKEMIAAQATVLRASREQRGAPKGEETYETRVLPKLYAGDVSEVYDIGLLANL